MRASTYAAKCIIVALIIATVFVFWQNVSAATVDELQTTIEKKNEEIKRLEEEAKKYRDEIVAKQQTGKTLKDELQKIERNIAQVRRDIAIAEQKIKKTQLEIDATALEIREKEIALKKLRDGLTGLLQILSEQEQKSPLAILLQHATLSDFFQQLDYSKSVEKKILGSLDTLRALQKELQVKKVQAQEKKEEFEDLKGELQDKKSVQEGIKKDRNDLLKSTQNQERKYQELLRETERKQEEILQDIEGLEENLRKLVDPSSLPTRRERFLKWPAEGLLSQGYGETPFTRSNLGRGFYKFHNGIDISSAIGTPIFAADDGTVLATGNTDRYCPRGAYGRYIVIDHKNNLATMYGHLSLIKVTNGQAVRRGDIIGYMGNSGLTTGPHLHFTLYDARTVEIRLGRIGTCGLLPFGGSINPLLYL